MGNLLSCVDGDDPKPIFRGERRHRFPLAPDSYANCPRIECACCGKNLRTCRCTCDLTGRCLCAGPLNYHRHDHLSAPPVKWRKQMADFDTLPIHCIEMSSPYLSFSHHFCFPFFFFSLSLAILALLYPDFDKSSNCLCLKFVGDGCTCFAKPVLHFVTL